MPDLRIAVLGLGSIGRRHLRNLKALGVANLIGFDPATDAAGAAGRECAVYTTDVLTDVWNFQPTAVFVTAPSHRHVPIALEAARHGCDLFIEKPLGDSVDGVPELRAHADRQRLITMVGCNMRFHPGPAAVRRLIQEGAVGPVLAARIHTGSYLPDWRPGTPYVDRYSAKPEQGGGAVLDCIHELDLALWYFGPAEPLAAAVRPAGSLGLRVDGLAEILLAHGNGVLSSVHLNFVQRDYRRFCEVIGETGTIYWSFDLPCVEVRGGPRVRRETLPSDWTPDQMFVDEAAEFLRCVRNRTNAPNGLAEAEQTLRLALCVRDGAAARQERTS